MSSLNYGQIWDSFTFAITFLPNTLILLFVPFVISVFLGLIIAIIRLWEVPVLAKLFQVMFTIFKGIPVYLLLIVTNLLYILYFDQLMSRMGINLSTSDISPVVPACIILIISFLPGVSELFRGGLYGIAGGQYEAGYAVGLTKLQTMRRIILPQVIPQIIPNMTNMLIGMLKASALAYSLGVTDIMNASVRAASNAYNLLEGYIAAAIIYWGLSIIIELIMKRLEIRVNRFQNRKVRTSL